MGTDCFKIHEVSLVDFIFQVLPEYHFQVVFPPQMLKPPTAQGNSEILWYFGAVASWNIFFTMPGALTPSAHLVKRPKFIYLAYM